MSKPAGWIVRTGDMKKLELTLNGTWAVGDIYDAARALIGFAEPQQPQPTQLPPVSVASLAPLLDEIVCACGETVTPGHTHPLPLDEPVNVPADPDVGPQPYDMPSPEADALDRIADLWGYSEPYGEKLHSIAMILRETGRLP